MKYRILGYFHELISNNVGGDRAYESRFKGFVGELEFSKWFREHRAESEKFSGGYFLPVIESMTTLNTPVYFTVSEDECIDSEYEKIYEVLADIPCRSMYFIHWDKSIPFEDWETQDVMGLGIMLPVPSMTVYCYDRECKSFMTVSLNVFLSEFTPQKRRKLSYGSDWKVAFIEKMYLYNFSELLELYVQRLIFDGFLGFGVKKGLPSDIDFIINSDVKCRLQFLEIKEKDLSKCTPRGFGMDTRRIDELRLIKLKTGIEYFYIVRRVNNQKERKFVEWLIIEIDDFNNHIGKKDIQGGTGMRAEHTDNPTRICPYRYFKKLK